MVRLLSDMRSTKSYLKKLILYRKFLIVQFLSTCVCFRYIFFFVIILWQFQLNSFDGKNIFQ